MNARFWPRAAGLTLIEILVTLAVLGLALMLLGNGLRLTFAAQGRISAAAQVLEERQAAVERLRALALRATPLALRRGDGGLTQAFIGTTDRLAWGVDGLAEAAHPGLHAVALRLEAGALILDYRALGAPGDAAARSLLLPGVTALRLTYFGRANGMGAPVWQDEWPAQEQVPRLLRLTLTFADGAPSLGISLPLGTLDATPLDALALSAEMTRQFDRLAGALGLSAAGRL
jgi:prepilin-type N-terminal cleavage/methylation domain-containing protein